MWAANVRPYKERTVHMDWEIDAHPLKSNPSRVFLFIALCSLSLNRNKKRQQNF